MAEHFCAYCGEPFEMARGCCGEIHECEHESGTRIQKYDSDGCGYYLWCCDNCEYTEIDTQP